MRSTTYTHIAFRNIGDSQDVGKYFEAPLSECILWLARELAQISMASRIVVGFGRTKVEAGKGIEVRGAGKSALNDDMQAMLRSVFDDSQEEEDQLNQPLVDVNTSQSSEDDYVA